MRRPTWLPLGLALVLPATGLLGACGPGVDTESTGGGGTTTTTTSSTGGSTTTNPTGGSGGIGGGGSGGIGGGGTGGIGGGGSGGTGGVGGQGGGPPPTNDQCPGEALEPALDVPVNVNGTLFGAIDDYTTFCADTEEGPGAPDVVYQIKLAAAATVTIEINGSGFIPALSLRKQDCSTRQNGDACLNLGSGDVSTKVALEAGTYWVVVDSADGDVGNFDFTVTAATPSCGDGAVNAGEQCDPGVAAGDDGCFDKGTAKECQFGEPPPDPAIIACPGGLVQLTKGPGGIPQTIQLGPYNNGAGGKNFDAPCSGGTPGPENVFHLVPNANGTMTAEIGRDEDGVSLFCDNPNNVCADFYMFLRKGSCTSVADGDQLGCTDYTENPNSPFGFDELLTIQVPVTANTDYWLVVDGLDDMYGIGPYFLRLTLE